MGESILQFVGEITGIESVFAAAFLVGGIVGVLSLGSIHLLRRLGNNVVTNVLGFLVVVFVAGVILPVAVAITDFMECRSKTTTVESSDGTPLSFEVRACRKRPLNGPWPEFSEWEPVR